MNNAILVADRFPMEVNGWHFDLDVDGMTYWKKEDEVISVVGLCWMDCVEGDEGYNPEHDCWLPVLWRGDDYWKVDDEIVDPDDDIGKAMLKWYEECWQLGSSIMRREEAERWLLNYMKEH